MRPRIAQGCTVSQSLTVRPRPGTKTSNWNDRSLQTCLIALVTVTCYNSSHSSCKTLQWQESWWCEGPIKAAKKLSIGNSLTVWGSTGASVFCIAGKTVLYLKWPCNNFYCRLISNPLQCWPQWPMLCFDDTFFSPHKNAFFPHNRFSTHFFSMKMAELGKNVLVSCIIDFDEIQLWLRQFCLNLNIYKVMAIFFKFWLKKIRKTVIILQILRFKQNFLSQSWISSNR